MTVECFGLLVFFSCTIPQAPPSDTYCQIAQPIIWRPEWPREAKEKIDIENRKWHQLCDKAK